MRRRRILTSPPPICACAMATSTADRLARARALARVAPNDPELMLTIGRAALESHDREAARARPIAPLLASDSPHGRPTRRACLLMADIEDAEGHEGAVREWLGRAARAPRDKAWVADGVITDRWAPVSPSGTLDAFVWRTPDERIAAPVEPPRLQRGACAVAGNRPAVAGKVRAGPRFASRAGASASARRPPLRRRARRPSSIPERWPRMTRAGRAGRRTGRFPALRQRMTRLSRHSKREAP